MTADGERRYSAREIAALLKVTKQAISVRAGREGWPSEAERGNGGIRHLYRLADLPADIAVEIERADASEDAAELGADPAAATGPAERSDKLWKGIEPRSFRARAAGRRRAEALLRTAARAERWGVSIAAAARAIAEETGFGASSIQRWHAKCRDWPRCDWPALLVDQERPGRPPSDIPDKAWKIFVDEYLRLHGPTMEAARERALIETAAEFPAGLPPLGAFKRRLGREFTPEEVILAREGARACAQLLPRMQIDRSGLEAGKHVSMDGVKLDSIWVDCGDGKPINTFTGWFIADMRTGFPMAYRLASTETSTLIRLAVKDLIAKWGIPDSVQVDSTMAAAAKTLSGRSKGLVYRGKARADDPPGHFTVLGIEVRTTKPPGNYNQAGSKLIERLFSKGGIHERIRQHPWMKGRGTSAKNPVKLDRLRKAVEACLREFVAKPGRRGQNVEGQSLKDAFTEARKDVTPRDASEEDLALLDCEVKRVSVSKRRGEFSLQLPGGKMARRYYGDPSLLPWRGRNLYAYYRPDNMNLPVRVVDVDGAVICAEVKPRPGAKFGDKEAGQKYSKHVARHVKATRQSLAAKREISKIERDVYRQLDAGGPDLPELGIAAAPAGPAEPAEAPAADGTWLVHDKDAMRRTIREADELKRRQREEAEAPLAIPAIGGGQ